MKKICQICGSQGWKESLVTCSKCRIACEHCYCMQKHTFDTSAAFICAECSMRPAQKNSAECSMRPAQKSSLGSFKAAVPRIDKNRVRVESSNPVPRWKTIPLTSKSKLISPEEASKLSSGGNKSTFKVPRPISAHSAMGLKKQTASFPRARSLNSAVVARRTNQILLPLKNIEPFTRDTLQIRSGVNRQASKAQAVVEGSKSKVADGAKYSASEEIRRSILSERLSQLRPYRPALSPTWKGRVVVSATPSEFNGEFLAQPASTLPKKAYRYSKAIPVLLQVRLVPIGNLLNDLFGNRIPGLSDVQMYLFSVDKNTLRFTEEHAHIFEVMKTHNAMLRTNIKGKPLLIFSSKLLDKSSQIFIQMQKKTNNFLWGSFLLKKKSVAHLPGSSSQGAQHFDDGDVVDNEIKPQFRYTSHQNPGKQLQRHYRERN
ncbi:PHD finger-containing protein 6 [Cardamine amara subsp. amara]|uniref:PHD finger-containing protein 6 n=1 Tax=Cardamine amara subsp. amara TaxID=228776 RepID=A0ABD1B829_CARAN